MGVTVWLETNGKRCQSEITMPYGCGRHYIAMRYNSTELCPCLPRKPRPPMRRPFPGSIRIIALSPSKGASPVSALRQTPGYGDGRSQTPSNDAHSQLYEQ